MLTQIEYQNTNFKLLQLYYELSGYYFCFDSVSLILLGVPAQKNA